ncbi:hypothetical protein [Paramaledivibacter caminithermalis]|uniref:Uncharacterized protein n=1 Tax=Paramaledivibacter caminithermalis (strain DSM 15212 / CIP 107654 / DViRD3) TaxID=1121301 RepID=A0A1M6N196_PARC5|nr:hypothetical protein [Paramaledivibacter caminithermalis]SHJ89480.1 hypothetical protein SAMN02745912_01525 [Paramaledivibacter caminithermalis DSM 15212]
MKLKKILVFTFISIILVVNSASYAADTTRIGSINAEDIINRVPLRTDNSYSSLHKNINTPYDIPSGDDYWRVTKSYNRTAYESFVKYLTSSWAKASSYTWSKSVSYSWSCSSSFSASAENAISSGLSFTKSRTKTYSVAITVDADSSRYSKLGFFADYKVYNVTAKLIDFYTGKVNETEKGELWEPTSETYLNIVYKR